MIFIARFSFAFKIGVMSHIVFLASPEAVKLIDI